MTSEVDEAVQEAGRLAKKVAPGDRAVVASVMARAAARLWAEHGGDSESYVAMAATHIRCERERVAAARAKAGPPESLLAWAQADPESRYLASVARTALKRGSDDE